MIEFFEAPDGARLAFDDAGAGVPLLCLAGLTRSMADFDYLAPHIPDCRMIRMDYRGRGASDWTGAATYSVPQEAQDALALMDHLGIDRFAVLGTSRGGLVGMWLAALAKPRLMGLCLNDVGPVIDPVGLERIFAYVGRNPAAQSHVALAEAYAKSLPGFSNIPASRWLEEAHKHAVATPDGLKIPYDPTLREAFLKGFEGPPVDLWPLFDALSGLPVALIRGANSDLLSVATADEMRRSRPDMIYVSVPDRAHIPFLDEAESLTAIHAFLKELQ
jgi:pimeloyl-ACP methyl ester carboxylesterase